MNTSPELSCFDCTLVCEIDTQLGQSKILRDQTVAESVRAMGQFAALEDADEDFTVLRTRWQNATAEIFSLLDSADEKLIVSRIGLLETCEAQRPVVDTGAENDAAVLRCVSALAEQAMHELGIQNED